MSRDENMQDMISASGIYICMGASWFAGLTGLFTLPFMLVLIDRILPEVSSVIIASTGAILLAFYLIMIFLNVRNVEWSATQTEIVETARPLVWLKFLVAPKSLTIRWKDVKNYSIGNFLLGGIVEAPAIRLRSTECQTMSIAFPGSKYRMNFENMQLFCVERLQAYAGDADLTPISFLKTGFGKGMVLVCALAFSAMMISWLFHAAYESLPIITIGAVVLSRMIKTALS